MSTNSEMSERITAQIVPADIQQEQQINAAFERLIRVMINQELDRAKPSCTGKETTNE